MQKTKALRETRAFAKTFAQKLLKEKGDSAHALVVALSGDLGSGKTSFTQGFAKALGIIERVTSPTFIIERIYDIDKKSFSRFVHIDAYRLRGVPELKTIGWNEILKDPHTIIIVEWAEKIRKAIPKDAHWLHFKYIDENIRHIHPVPHSRLRKINKK